MWMVCGLAGLASPSCETVETNRVPAFNVYLDLTTQGIWDVFGVHGYGDYRYFSRESRIPANFAYTERSATGYGGVLLIYGINGPMAYDRACPVEVDKNAVLRIDSDNLEAYCPTCGSRYNVLEADGAPVAGTALERRYGLQRLSVSASSMGGYLVTR